MIRTLAKVKPLLADWRSRKNALIASGIVGLAGVALVLLSLAATGITGLEAESATINGNAHTVTDSSASGGGALHFGAAAASGSLMPAWTKVFTGGDSIAFRWKAVDTSLHPSKFHVFRDGQEVTVVDIPVWDGLGKEVPGTSYIDKNVVEGTGYTYQVQTEAVDGTLSEKTSPVSITHKVGIGVPTVVVEANGINDPAFVNKTEADIKTWYPKAELLTVNGAYAVPTKITLRLSTDTEPCNAIAYAMPSDAVFVACPVARQLGDNSGLTIHEITHILQQFTTSGMERMLVEGGADWTANYLLSGLFLEPSGPYFYDDGYSQGAYFLEWIMTTYDAELMHKLYAAAHTGTRAQDVIMQSTGKTLGQLWTQMTGRYTSTHGALKDGDYCVIMGAGEGVLHDNVVNSPRLQSCVGSGVESFIYGSDDGTPVRGILKDSYSMYYCLKPVGNTVGAIVQYDDCFLGLAAYSWEPTAGGGLKHVESGLCLRPKNGVLAIDSLLELAECADTADQKWTLPTQ